MLLSLSDRKRDLGPLARSCSVAFHASLAASKQNLSQKTCCFLQHGQPASNSNADTSDSFSRNIIILIIIILIIIIIIIALQV